MRHVYKVPLTQKEMLAIITVESLILRLDTNKNLTLLNFDFLNLKNSLRLPEGLYTVNIR